MSPFYIPWLVDYIYIYIYISLFPLTDSLVEHGARKIMKKFYHIHVLRFWISWETDLYLFYTETVYLTLQEDVPYLVAIRFYRYSTLYDVNIFKCFIVSSMINLWIIWHITLLGIIQMVFSKASDICFGHEWHLQSSTT